MSDGEERRGPSGRTRADWQRLVAAYERREGSRQAFCAEAGVSANSLDYWRRKLRREGSGSAPSGFVELSASQAPEGNEAEAWAVELELGGGMVLRLSRG